MNKEELKNIIINKKGFPFYTDYWQQYFSRLSGEQCKDVLKLICEFALTGEQESSQDFGVDMVANSIITNITRDAIKREKRIFASRENGKGGGRPKKDKPKDDKPTKPKFTPPTLEEIKAYCEERKNNINPKSFFDYYEAGNWKDAKGNAVKNWKQKLLTWEKKDTSDSIPKNDIIAKINEIAGDNYIIKTYEEAGVLKIVCRSPSSRSKIYDLSENKKNEIKALFGNQKFEFVC